MSAEDFLQWARLFPDPLLLLRLDGEILAGNAAAEEALGVKEGSSAGCVSPRSSTTQSGRLNAASRAGHEARPWQPNSLACAERMGVMRG